ncbi:MAG: polymer-forming cytoskeletal protein, partial [Candidatus Giovannonibacteria bacterium]|nr:polymer-forming cytoskeletal protein [Candidatus Giovannonibacteria bacterium]
MKDIRFHHIFSFLAAGGIVLAAFNFNSNSQPFRPIEEFVLFASDKIHLAEDVQSLRGNIGSNKEIKIGEHTQITGDLFSDKIHLAGEVVINGSVFAKRLKLAQNAKILGVSSTEITFPVAQIPEIPPFLPGGQDIKIQPNQETTLYPGSFRDLEIGENSKITFQPGIYNLRSFTAKENAKLILESITTFNIAEDIKFSENTSLFSKNNQISPDQILFQTPTKKSINFGKNSSLVFRLIAPNSKVRIAENSLIRGNIWASEIFIAERAVLRDTAWFSIPSDPEDIIQVGIVRFFVNIVNVNFTSGATAEDAERIAQLLDAKIVGFEPTTNLYSFQIPTRTKEELDAAIAKIKALN